MEIKIQSIHLDTTKKSEVFIKKRVGKLEKTLGNIRKIEVQLKLIGPATVLNKQTAITVAVPGGALFVKETCDTFEEGIGFYVDVVWAQVSKYKERMRTH